MLLLTSLNAHAYTISGYVRDQNGVGMANVTVALSEILERWGIIHTLNANHYCGAWGGITQTYLLHFQT
jgi:hypothetical protein